MKVQKRDIIIIDRPKTARRVLRQQPEQSVREPAFVLDRPIYANTFATPRASSSSLRMSLLLADSASVSFRLLYLSPLRRFAAWRAAVGVMNSTQRTKSGTRPIQYAVCAKMTSARLKDAYRNSRTQWRRRMLPRKCEWG